MHWRLANSVATFLVVVYCCIANYVRFYEPSMVHLESERV